MPSELPVTSSLEFAAPTICMKRLAFEALAAQIERIVQDIS